MGASNEKISLIVVQGPTAVGKTELAIRIAEEFQGEVVNADSLQWVKHFDIGTAKPSAAERARVPHHLFDAIEPDDPADVADYLAAARPLIADIAVRGNVPVVAGGTGLYVRALLGGLVALPGADANLRARYDAIVAESGVDALFAELAARAPEAADHIDPKNPRRVVRALEVLELTGKPIWQWQAEHRFSERPYRSLRLAIRPDWEKLAERVKRRTARMLQAGLVSEVHALLSRWPDESLKAYGAIGYAEVLAVLNGEIRDDELADAIERATMRYAKKQIRWLNTERDPIVWIDEGDEQVALAEACAFLSGA